MSDTIKIDGITFECDYRIDEDNHGDDYLVLEGVKIGDQDITDIISEEWWEKIEQRLSNRLKGYQDDLKLDAELSRLEAYGV